MPWLALALLAVEAAQPATRPVAVLAVSKRPGAESWIASTSERVHAALEREGVVGLLPMTEAEKQLAAVGMADPRSCQGARSCVGRLAVILAENGVVVAVDVAKAGSSLAVKLEAVSGDGPRVLASTDLLLPVGKWDDQLALPVVLFARSLKEKLEAEAPPPPADAPVATAPPPDLTPPPQPPPVAEVAAAPAPRPRVLPWVLVGAAVVFAGAAAALAATGAADQASIRDSVQQVGGEPVSSLSRTQLQALEKSGNTKFSLALASGIAAGALGVGASITFAVGP